MKSFKRLQTLGYLIADLPSELIISLNAEVDELLQKKENKTIKHRNHILSITQLPVLEYYITKSLIPLNNFIKTIVPDYMLAHGEDYIELSKLPYFLIQTDIPSKKAAWVNINKKGEYAIPHTHKGLLSFVIWLKIPYDLKEEALHLETTNNISNMLPGFAFIHQNLYQGDRNIKNHLIPLDRTFENKIVLFPASLPHFVTPFQTSDDYRISISGNIQTIDSFKWPI